MGVTKYFLFSVTTCRTPMKRSIDAEHQVRLCMSSVVLYLCNSATIVTALGFAKTKGGVGSGDIDFPSKTKNL